ncbi:MAG: hypothetical protein H0U91_12260 [Rubrobacter sp.]|nr:hypothetical protein [Rubrobacter sp.]
MLSPRRIYREPGGEGDGKERVGYHLLLAARTPARGEDGLAEYVARLDLGECARILVACPIPPASPIPLSTLAARDPASRVGADEDRSFEEEVRYWTLWVLSGLEGD